MSELLNTLIAHRPSMFIETDIAGERLSWCGKDVTIQVQAAGFPEVDSLVNILGMADNVERVENVTIPSDLLLDDCVGFNVGEDLTQLCRELVYYDPGGMGTALTTRRPTGRSFRLVFRIKPGEAAILAQRLHLHFEPVRVIIKAEITHVGLTVDGPELGLANVVYAEPAAGKSDPEQG